MKLMTSAFAAILLGALLSATPADANVRKTIVNGNNNFKQCPTNGNNNHRVPEPSTLILLGAGLTGLAVSRLRKQ